MTRIPDHVRITPEVIRQIDRIVAHFPQLRRRQVIELLLEESAPQIVAILEGADQAVDSVIRFKKRRLLAKLEGLRTEELKREANKTWR
jgi:hypothetical protein